MQGSTSIYRQPFSSLDYACRMWDQAVKTETCKQLHSTLHIDKMSLRLSFRSFQSYTHSITSRLSIYQTIEQKIHQKEKRESQRQNFLSTYMLASMLRACALAISTCEISQMCTDHGCVCLYIYEHIHLYQLFHVTLRGYYFL